MPRVPWQIRKGARRPVASKASSARVVLPRQEEIKRARSVYAFDFKTKTLAHRPIGEHLEIYRRRAAAVKEFIKENNFSGVLPIKIKTVISQQAEYSYSIAKNPEKRAEILREEIARFGRRIKDCNRLFKAVSEEAANEILLKLFRDQPK